MGKQTHAELAEVSLGSLDATRLLLQMPAVLSAWLPGDGNADLQNGSACACYSCSAWPMLTLTAPFHPVTGLAASLPELCDY